MTDQRPDGSDPEPASEPAPEPADDGTAGRMRFQDERTTPREATLAERKARERARRRAEEEQRRVEEQQQRSRTRRRRVLVGAGVTVGVVALIAVGYAAAQPEEEIQAQCVDDDGVIVDDANCVTPAADGATYHTGGGFYPIFIGAGGRQYHYNYGGTGTVGDRVSGGTTTVPRQGTRVRTGSGSGLSTGSTAKGSSGGSSVSSDSGSGSVSRGGLGSSSRGSSSGG